MVPFCMPRHYFKNNIRPFLSSQDVSTLRSLPKPLFVYLLTLENPWEGERRWADGLLTHTPAFTSRAMAASASAEIGEWNDDSLFEAFKYALLERRGKRRWETSERRK